MYSWAGAERWMEQRRKKRCTLITSAARQYCITHCPRFVLPAPSYVIADHRDCAGTSTSHFSRAEAPHWKHVRRD